MNFLIRLLLASLVLSPMAYAKTLKTYKGEACAYPLTPDIVDGMINANTSYMEQYALYRKKSPQEKAASRPFPSPNSYTDVTSSQEYYPEGPFTVTQLEEVKKHYNKRLYSLTSVEIDGNCREPNKCTYQAENGTVLCVGIKPARTQQ